MKLYYTPGACSMAPHITLIEAGLSFDLEQVDLKSHKTADGEDYTQINPKGYVPAIRLNDGTLLTEVGTVLQYVADQKPDSGLAPRAGTLERYRLMEWLNFIATEIHKQFGPLFRPNVSDEVKTQQAQVLGRRCDYVSKQLAGKAYLMGDRFGVADAYLFTVLNWSNLLKVDLLSARPDLKNYMARIAGRPAVLEAMRAEGLVK